MSYYEEEVFKTESLPRDVDDEYWLNTEGSDPRDRYVPWIEEDGSCCCWVQESYILDLMKEAEEKKQQSIMTLKSTKEKKIKQNNKKEKKSKPRTKKEKITGKYNKKSRGYKKELSSNVSMPTASTSPDNSQTAPIIAPFSTDDIEVASIVTSNSLACIESPPIIASTSPDDIEEA
ncbi:hypothetical protein NGRA_3474, partial [Nosema granulosis]